LLVTAAGSAWAHHGWSEYDANKRATLTGTVRELHFGNPHVTLLLETPDKVWNVMLASPAPQEQRRYRRHAGDGEGDHGRRPASQNQAGRVSG
jgi:hypothetical protein